jgi:ElaB/YqjD/DUF883 family membrane-anchored ribosome-binding protein
VRAASRSPYYEAQPSHQRLADLHQQLNFLSAAVINKLISKMAARLKAILGHLTGPTVTLTGPAAAAVQSILMGARFARSKDKLESYLAFENSSVELAPSSAIDWLHRVAAAIQASRDKLHPILHEAYTKASSGAKAIEGFVEDHPVFCLVIALGVLYIMAPTAVQLLGFTPKGPAFGMCLLYHTSMIDTDHCIKGSYAAAWESTYGGTVPAKSLFAYLQHLGMTMVV